MLCAFDFLLVPSLVPRLVSILSKLCREDQQAKYQKQIRDDSQAISLE